MALPLLLALLGAGPIGDVDFVREVQPLLSDRCFKCHGPDAQARKADLRLDDRAAALAAGAIVPGDPDQSLLVERIHADAGERMPPIASKLSLSERERATLVRWIAEGAPYAGHWAWRSAADPDLPPADGWSRDALDRFVHARMTAAGLAPQTEADRGTWLRRASFVLTGLPPTPAELEAFGRDLGEDAYERQVERLLASPRFGERMASDWLDVARYADTYGYQADVYREVWPWRDWVISAFNENLPYDQFVTWQLAGDLLPDATAEQRLATAFNRLHRQTNEGGSVEEEFRVEYVSDRVHTFATAFLGLTMECARCHDHKYDPISQREYYALSSFFANIDESGLYSHFTPAVPTPTVELPTDYQRKELESTRAAGLEAAYRAAETDEAAFRVWCAGSDRLGPLPGLQGFYAMDGSAGRELANTVAGGQPGQFHGGNARSEGVRGGGLELTGDDAVTFPGVGHFARHDAFSLGLWVRVAQPQDRYVVLHRSKAWHDSASRGLQILLEEGHPSFSLIHFWPGDAVRIRAIEALPVGEWTHLAVTSDGSARAAGLRLYINGAPAEVEVVRDKLTRTILRSGEGDLTLGERFRDNGFKGGRVDELAVFARALAPLEVAVLVHGPAVWADASLEDLRAVFRSRPDDVAVEAARADWLEELRRLGGVRDTVRQVMAMVEEPEPRPVHVLMRGMYDQPGEEVSAGVPSILPPLPPLPPGARPNRLDLARWLVDPAHPLTARVTVNRLWALSFGGGLVGTPENFGVQGSPPTHPELLDHLASTFVASGWDVKHLLRRFVLSATFRQAAGAAPELDPGNELYSVGPSLRLPAEMLRDQVLLVSGQLVERIGGASVKPYQPAGLWQEKSGHVYVADQGEGLHRRSLYTIWKRTSPPPAMLILDAAKRDVCVVQRHPTQSPLQVLLFWNDPQYVEAARALAEDLLRSYDDDRVRLSEAFLRLTSRRPHMSEVATLLALLEDLRADYRAAPEDAMAALAVGQRPVPDDLDPIELACWSLLAATLFSHHAVTTLR